MRRNLGCGSETIEKEQTLDTETKRHNLVGMEKASEVVPMMWAHKNPSGPIVYHSYKSLLIIINSLCESQTRSKILKLSSINGFCKDMWQMFISSNILKGDLLDFNKLYDNIMAYINMLGSVVLDTVLMDISIHVFIIKCQEILCNIILLKHMFHP